MLNGVLVERRAERALRHTNYPGRDDLHKLTLGARDQSPWIALVEDLFAQWIDQKDLQAAALDCVDNGVVDVHVAEV